MNDEEELDVMLDDEDIDGLAGNLVDEQLDKRTAAPDKDCCCKKRRELEERLAQRWLKKQTEEYDFDFV